MILAAVVGAAFVVLLGVPVGSPSLPAAPAIFTERHPTIESPRIPDDRPEEEPPRIVRRDPAPSPPFSPAPPPVVKPSDVLEPPVRHLGDVANDLAHRVVPGLGFGAPENLASVSGIANLASPGPFPLKYSGKEGLLSVSGGRVEFAGYERARSFSAGCDEIRSTSVITNRPQTRLQIVLDRGKYEMIDANSGTADKALDAIIHHCRSVKG